MGGRLTQMLKNHHRDMILTDQGFHLKVEQYRQFLEAIYGPCPQQIFFLLEKCLVRKMKMHENEGGGLTQMLIKSHRVMILTDHGFHLKGEQYRQFLEAIYGPYLQQIFFLLEKYLFRNMKIHKSQGGRAHSDANKILQRHDIDKSRVSFERRIVQTGFRNHIWTISPIEFFSA